jgi:hypothetical protein
MNFMEQLLAIFTGDSELKEETKTQIINIAKAYISEFDGIKNNLTKFENEVKDRDTKIEALNTNITEIKGLLGVGADVPLNAELINSKINKNEDLEKVESKYNEIIGTLNTNFANEKAQIEQTIKAKEDEIYNLKLDNKISHLVPTIGAKENALDDVIRYIKEGATIKSDGSIGYSNADGILIRNTKGFEMTVQDRVDEIKESRDYLFNSNIQQGGGVGGGNPSTNSKGLSAFGLEMLQRAKRQQGY